MALAQFPSERFRGSFTSLGAVHRCGAVHPGRVANTGAQVHLELVQRVSVQPVRGPALCDAHGWHVVRRVTIGDIHQSVEDSRRIHVQRSVAANLKILFIFK